MRESVGGTLLLQIVLVFLVVFIGFMAIVINYGKVFRVKNKIINYIEQQEGYSDCESLRTHLTSVIGYNGEYEIKGTDIPNRGTLFAVEIYIEFELPIIKNIIKIPVKGETRLIETAIPMKDAELTCTKRVS